MDDKSFAEKQIDVLYLCEKIDTSDLAFHTITILDKNILKFQVFCDKLRLLDPIKNVDRFLNVINILNLYLHPNLISTASDYLHYFDKNKEDIHSQLQSQSQSQSNSLLQNTLLKYLLEKKLSNSFSDTYIQNYTILVKTICDILKDLPDNADNADNADNKDDSSINTDLCSLRSLHRFMKIEKGKIDNQLFYYDNPIALYNNPISDMFYTLNKHAKNVKDNMDAFNFISRLKSLTMEIHNIIQFMEKQRSFKGVVIPETVAKKYYEYLQNLITTDVLNQPFIATFKDVLISRSISLELHKIAVDLMKNSVYRSLYHFADWIKEFFLEEDGDTYENTNTDENINNVESISICVDKNKGAEYYKYLLNMNNYFRDVSYDVDSDLNFLNLRLEEFQHRYASNTTDSLKCEKKDKEDYESDEELSIILNKILDRLIKKEIEPNKFSFSVSEHLAKSYNTNYAKELLEHMEYVPSFKYDLCKICLSIIDAGIHKKGWTRLDVINFIKREFVSEEYYESNKDIFGKIIELCISSPTIFIF